MTVKTRSELEAYFKNGKRPSQKEFGEFIASVLNKRDDQFFGRWTAGITYRNGDIVIHGRALWEMYAEAPICSHDPPAEGANWRMLLVQTDSDWNMEERLGELEGRVSSTEQRLDDIDSRADDFQQRLDSIDQRLDDLTLRTGDVEQRVGDVEQRVDALEAQVNS